MEAEQERILKLLEERIETHDDSRRAAQDKLHEICENLRAQIDELEDRANGELEKNFAPKDNRLQEIFNKLRENYTASALKKAKAELLVTQSYEVVKRKSERKEEKKKGDENDEDENNDENDYGIDLSTLCDLKTRTCIDPEMIEMRKPEDLDVVEVKGGNVFVQFTCFNPDEERIFSEQNFENPTEYRCMIFKKGNEQDSKEYPLDKEGDSSLFTFTPSMLEVGATYRIRAKMIVGGREGEWSDIAEFSSTPEFKQCRAWEECPDDVHNNMKYSVDKENPGIATKINGYDFCTIIGNTRIPLNAVMSLGIKILKSKNNDGDGIFIGAAPFDINRNDVNYFKCGWYINCYDSTLWSGPPHNYDEKAYGPRKKDGEYVHTGDSVGVVMDTTKGVLSFVLNNVNLDVAYKGIPLDKPLVPCVILKSKGDSIELDTSEIKENIDSSIPILSKIALESTSWDTITLTWSKVTNASSYQIEVDRNTSWDAVTTNTFTKRGFLPDTRHKFRVRAVRGSSVGGWSNLIRGKTLKKFSGCAWKECPERVNRYMKYRVDGGNPRIATKINEGLCTIIGNKHVFHDTKISWNIKILKSINNDGNGILIGVAPFNINQDMLDNYNNCGWYFYCYSSTLWSGPPHNYNDRKYGPRKGPGEYVHTGDSVGVVMETKKGELSFVLNGVNLDVAYEGIPLDKPLVPCALLYHGNDSVELIT